MSIHAETRRRRRERGLMDEVARCSKCDAPNGRAPQRYCAECNRAYQAEWKRKRVFVLRETLTDEQKSRLHVKYSVSSETT